jgi:two-component system, LuxR family, response regulator FixJ
MSTPREQALIAILDDEPSVRRGLERLVRAGGYPAAAYSSGDDLLRSLEDGDDPACIVLDLHMPGLSGFDILEALAQRGDRVPVIAITADSRTSTAARAIKLGARACLNKPVEGSVLLEAIRIALDSGQI